MAERRQSWLFEYEVLGGHTHVTVRCGPQDHSRAKCGDLVLENAEWERFYPMIVRGCLALANAEDFGPTEVEVREKWQRHGAEPMAPAKHDALSDEAWLEELADARVPEEGGP